MLKVISGERFDCGALESQQGIDVLEWTSVKCPGPHRQPLFIVRDQSDIL